MQLHASFSSQVSIYLGKCFRIFRSERRWTSFLSTAIILVLVCAVTGDDMFQSAEPTQKGCFALVCACIWIGIFNSIRSVCSERAILKREHRTGLRITAYLTAHVLYEAIICLLECLVITLIVFLRNRETVPARGVLLPGMLELFLDFFLILFSSDLLGLLVSCIVRNENTAMTVMPFLLIAEMVFANVIFHLEGFTERLSALMISRWGLAALCVTADFNGLVIILEPVDDYTHTVAHQLGLWGLLLLFSAIFFGLSVLFLSQVDRDRR